MRTLEEYRALARDTNQSSPLKEIGRTLCVIAIAYAVFFCIGCVVGNLEVMGVLP